jgi:hypothetical protein
MVGAGNAFTHSRITMRGTINLIFNELSSIINKYPLGFLASQTVVMIV